MKKTPQHTRILIVSPTQGAYGGIEAFILALGKYLLTQKDFEVRICFKLVKGFSMQPALTAIVESTGLEYSVVNRASVDLLLAIQWADLVHAQNASPDIALLARLCNAKLVQTIHNHLLGRGFTRTLSWRFGSSLAHFRTYNSNFVRNTWESEPQSNSAVIPTVSELKQDFAPIEPRRGFLFISRLIPNKGAEILIEAYQRADLDRQLHPLLLIGDGPMRETLEALRRKAPDGITLAGFVTESEKQKCLRQARWLVAPANTKEDMGLTPLEARANGIPVIVSRDGGLPESAGHDALLCEPGNADDLRRQLECAVGMSDEEYSRRARSGYEFLTQHLKPLSFYTELYRRLLS